MTFFAWLFGPDGRRHVAPILMAMTMMALIGGGAVVIDGALKMVRRWRSRPR